MFLFAAGCAVNTTFVQGSVPNLWGGTQKSLVKPLKMGHGPAISNDCPCSLNCLFSLSSLPTSHILTLFLLPYLAIITGGGGHLTLENGMEGKRSLDSPVLQFPAELGPFVIFKSTLK